MFDKLKSRFARATRRPQSDVEPGDLEFFGLNNLCRLARIRSYWQHRQDLRDRQQAYANDLPQLLRENGDSGSSSIRLKDGYAIYTRKDLPHLDRVYEEAEEFIALRGGKPREPGNRAFIKDLIEPGDLERFPSFLDFATSSAVVEPVCHSMKMVPRLSDLVPPPVRLTESTIQGQVAEGEYFTSQLFHLDFHDKPVVYVILLLRDVGPQSGPFCFLPSSVSARVARELKYGKRNIPYRLTDEQVASVVDEDEIIRFEGSRGDVLFLESNACFHFGSRDCHVPRYQLMIAYVSPCRTDFSDLYMDRNHLPASPSDSRLRQMLFRSLPNHSRKSKTPS